MFVSLTDFDQVDSTIESQRLSLPLPAVESVHDQQHYPINVGYFGAQISLSATDISTDADNARPTIIFDRKNNELPIIKPMGSVRLILTGTSKLSPPTSVG